MLFNRTRRQTRAAVCNYNDRIHTQEVRVKSWADETYECYLPQGATLYKYMVDNFESMFDGGTVKHFCITEKHRRDYEDVIGELMYTHNEDIQKQLVHWIHNEYLIGNLTVENNWKPFCELEYETTYFMGYRKMFKYKQYYFQLALISYCDKYDYCDNLRNCIYCTQETNRNHFELNLYGWVDETNNKLQPDNWVVIPENNMMPRPYWNSK
jgi:hypothetical protein